MRYRMLLMLAALPALGSAEDLTVSLQADSQISIAARSVLQREVESLLTPTGIRVLWHLDSTPPSAERLAVIHLKGSCTSGSGLLKTGSIASESLGKTHIVNGNVLPKADIRCDAIRQFISTELRRTRSEQRDELFGRALGRVVSHELYHILLRTTSHGREGIARPAQTSAELVADRSAFSRADERRLATVYTPESDSSEPASGR